MQDYVKWRGPLFHHFLQALVDEDAGVRGLAEHLLTDSLASKVSTYPPCSRVVSCHALANP